MDGLLNQPWDFVVTVCDDANATCPVFPARTTRLHWSVPDPSQVSGTEEQQLDAFRRVRDDIRRRIADWLKQ